MVRLKINPNLPLCWEDHETLRVGFEAAHARLHDPSPGVQRLLYAMLRGIDPDRLSEFARVVGISSREAEGVFTALSSTLVAAEPAEPATRELTQPRTGAGTGAGTGTDTLSIAVCDTGRPVPGLVEAIAGTGLCRLEREDEQHQPELVILVDRFLGPLERAQRWLMTGVPHLLLRFTDTAVHVGPIVVSPGAPCHACVALTLVASDPAYPVLAAQLANTVPPSETIDSTGVAVGYAATLIRDWLDGGPRAHNTRIVIPTSCGRVLSPPRFETVAPHPECACALG